MKRRTKQILTVSALVLSAALLGMALTGWPAQQNRSRRIIYIYKTVLGEIEFWRSVSDGIQVGAQEFDYQTTILGAKEESDIEGNIEALQRAISLQPDAIVLVAADYERLEPYAERVREAGILLLTMDSAVQGDAASCFVGTDNYQIGRRMGEEMLNRIPPGRPVAVVSHVETAKTAIDRVQGISDALGEAGTNELLPAVSCDNIVSRAEKQAAALLETYPELGGFIATNEMSALGVGRAVVSAGRQDSVTVVTCDNSSRQIEYLEQGVISATIVQKPFSMGYFSVKLVDDLLNGHNAVPAFYDTGSEVITLENYFTLENQKLLFPIWD